MVSLKKALAAAFIVLLAAVLAWALLPYINAFFGAFVLAVLFRPLYNWLRSKKLAKGLSASIVIISTIVLALIPLAIILTIVLNQAYTLLQEPTFFINLFESVDRFLPQIDITNLLKDQLSKIGSASFDILLGTFRKAGNALISLTIMYFLLYFLLVTEPKKLQKMMHSISPFNKKNTERLVKEFDSITYSTIITTGAIALIQGTLMAIAFKLFGLPGAVLWGFVTAVASFLPVVGPTLVWVPAALFLFLQKNYLGGVGMLVAGGVVSTVDNFIRPTLQKRVGDIHPLISLLGIFVGVSLFGLIGIVIGPLLLSYFMLTTKMYIEENGS